MTKCLRVNLINACILNTHTHFISHKCVLICQVWEKGFLRIRDASIFRGNFQLQHRLHVTEIYIHGTLVQGTVTYVVYTYTDCAHIAATFIKIQRWTNQKPHHIITFENFCQIFSVAHRMFVILFVCKANSATLSFISNGITMTQTAFLIYFFFPSKSMTLLRFADPLQNRWPSSESLTLPQIRQLSIY